MRPSIALMVVACWSTPCTIAAAQPRCIVISGTADALGKNNAVEKSLKSLREAIDKWKTDNNVTGPVRETPHKPTPNPYWRSSVSPHLLLPPDVPPIPSAGQAWCHRWFAPPARSFAGEP